MIGTFEEQWLAQGEAKGEAKGREDREALRETLMRLITRRFGASLAQSVAPRIQAIGSVETLNEMVDLVAMEATADSLPRRSGPHRGGAGGPGLSAGAGTRKAQAGIGQAPRLPSSGLVPAGA